MGNCSSDEKQSKQAAQMRALEARRVPGKKRQQMGPANGVLSARSSSPGKRMGKSPAERSRRMTLQPPQLTGITALNRKTSKVQDNRSPPLTVLSLETPRFDDLLSEEAAILSNLSSPPADTALMKTQKESVFADWNEFHWPWVWELAEPPNPYKSTTDDYKSFLKTFRILTASEVQAHEAWKTSDLDEAKRILDAEDNNEVDVLSCTVLSDGSSTLGTPLSENLMSTYQGNKVIVYKKHDDVLNERVEDPSDYCMTPYVKNSEQTEVITRSLSKCPLFSHLIRPVEIQQIALAMRPVSFRKGEEVLRRGCLPRATTTVGLFVVYNGRLTIDDMYDIVRGKIYGGYLATGVAGQVRGKHNVTAATDVDAFVLENNVFSGVMGALAYQKRNLYASWLDRLPLLKNLSGMQLLQLSDALEEHIYRQGEKIISFGTKGEWMHFIVEGEVDVWGRDERDHVLIPGLRKYVCTFGPGHPVGYLEFFDSDVSSRTIADVEARSATVITARLSRDHFEASMGPVKDILQELTEAPEYAYYRKTQAQRKMPPRSPSPELLNLEDVLDEFEDD